MTLDSLTRILIQLVQLPLYSIVLFTAVALAWRVKGSERWMLYWFAGGVAFAILIATIALYAGATHNTLGFVGAGLLPPFVSLCFLVSMRLWWQGRKRG